MTLEQELLLSWYREVAEINAAHGIFLVQDVRDRKFYVRKRLTVYQAEVYCHLMTHPVANTPRIYAVVEEPPVLTVIEEYIPGDTLLELLDRVGVLTPEQAVSIAAALCTILESFHSCTPAIVNRDIKPSNIKLSPDGVVKLIDLNAAKWSNDRAEQDTVLLGTRGYAAPEQYGFGPSSVLTDVYAVGVLLNVMLTGMLPNQRTAEGPVGQVIRKCVELSPSARYQSAAALRTALEALDGRPEPKPKANRREYLPPGFRTRSVLRWIFSAMGYAFLIRLGLSLEMEGASVAELVINRIAVTAALIAIVFFNGNYLGVHQRFAMTRSPSRPVRWLGMALVDLGLLLAACTMAVLLSP